MSLQFLRYSDMYNVSWEFDCIILCYKQPHPFLGRLSVPGRLEGRLLGARAVPGITGAPDPSLWPSCRFER